MSERISVQDLVEQFSDFLNSGMRWEKENFAGFINKDHRIIQDEAFGLFFNCIKQWAWDYENNNYDFRNERACKASYEMVKALQVNGWK